MFAFDRRRVDTELPNFTLPLVLHINYTYVRRKRQQAQTT